MTTIQQPGPSQPDAGDYAYNLFRNKQCPEIICAVPEDRPAPHFIDAEQWTFEQPLRPLEARPPASTITDGMSSLSSKSTMSLAKISALQASAGGRSSLSDSP